MHRVLADGKVEDAYTAYWRVGYGDVIPCPCCMCELQPVWGEPDRYQCASGSVWVDEPFTGCIEPTIEIIGDTP